MKTLPHSFFQRKTLTVARDLVGKYLVRQANNKTLREEIIEVEAYVGPHDLASHASKGKTRRTGIMFREAGTIYVYFVYGMHWMLNIVTEKKDFPAAILIRATRNFKGPGRVTKGLTIDKKLNGHKLSRKTGLWIETDEKISHRKISRTARIGVSYAGPIWSQKPYRFILSLPR